VADDSKTQQHRRGKKAAQFFLDPHTLARFKAACAFASADMTEVIDRLMGEYSDAMGIPATLPTPPAKSRPRHK
jgi:hypothetical protein